MWAYNSETTREGAKCVHRASYRLLVGSFLNISGLTQVTRYLRKTSYMKCTIPPKNKQTNKGVGEGEFREQNDTVLIIINVLRKLGFNYN